MKLGIITRLNRLKAEIHALYFALRHPQTPWYAKLLIACVVAYAFSPIDLIPDFVPVLGYLDDLLIVPLGIYLCIRLLPEHVLAECRLKAQTFDRAQRPVNWFAAAVIITVWISLAVAAAWWLYRHFI